MIYKEITKCRICGNQNLQPIIDLGSMALTGIFPKPGELVASAPLEIVKCWDGGMGSCCGLVQLKHTCDLEQLYGDNYGYRSGLNSSMVEHLKGLVKEIEKRIQLTPDDLVVDIASNDGTLLSSYPSNLGLEGEIVVVWYN
jgi:NDP-4-keto-2,6-dideoxyhexose 3-C-methyltransferase